MARKISDLNEDHSAPVDSQLQTQSRELYANFVREEIQLQGLQVPPEIPSLVYYYLTYTNFLQIYFIPS